jgi:hypothetical protein
VGGENERFGNHNLRVDFSLGSRADN